MRLLPLKQSNLLKKEFEEAIIKSFQKNIFLNISFEVEIESTSLFKINSKKLFWSAKIWRTKKCVVLNVFLTKINDYFSSFIEITKVTLTNIYSF